MRAEQGPTTISRSQALRSGVGRSRVTQSQRDQCRAGRTSASRRADVPSRRSASTAASRSTCRASPGRSRRRARRQRRATASDDQAASPTISGNHDRNDCAAHARKRERLPQINERRRCAAAMRGDREQRDHRATSPRRRPARVPAPARRAFRRACDAPARATPCAFRTDDRETPHWPCAMSCA